MKLSWARIRWTLTLGLAGLRMGWQMETSVFGVWFGMLNSRGGTRGPKDVRVGFLHKYLAPEPDTRAKLWHSVILAENLLANVIKEDPANGGRYVDDLLFSCAECARELQKQRAKI